MKEPSDDDLSPRAHQFLAVLLAELWDEYSDEKLLQKLLHADRYGFGKTEADEIRSLLKRMNDWLHIDEV